jgi:molybdopterin/thiamine biosynthesis adenylyltransferase
MNRIQAVALIGLGNIGSQAVQLLAHLRGLAEMALIDHDRYDAGNLTHQNCLQTDIGRSKARAQAERLREINPRLRITVWTEDVATVPLGRLRGHLLLSAVDAMECRLAINRMAWRLGVPWIDTGVDPARWLGRVTVYRPGPNRPCFECALDNLDYEALPRRFVCGVNPAGGTATNGPASLGALTAALMTIEAGKILSHEWNHTLAGRQLVVDAQHHQYYTTSLRRHQRCRFDHQTWQTKPLPGCSASDTLETLLTRALGNDSPAEGLALHVESRPFIRCLRCPRCARSHHYRVPHLQGPDTARTCRHCGRSLLPVGFTTLDALPAPLPKEDARVTLADLGLRPGDMFSLQGCQVQNHYEIQSCP